MYGQDGGDPCYYVLDARTVVGNCAMWWCPQGQGYTCNIDEAGLYTEADVKKMRASDIPIHRDVVQAMTIKHVRLDHLRQCGHLAAYDKAQAEAAEVRRNRSSRTAIDGA